MVGLGFDIYGCEYVYCDRDQLGWDRLTRIFKVQRHIL